MTIIHPETKMGPVSLTVANLDRSLRFYRHGLGLSVHRQVNGRVHLAASRSASPLLELVESTGARPRPAYSTGLFHLALLVPTRRDLGLSLRRLAELRWPLQGAADHGVSEALYLADPDGNGIEIYADRPQDLWPRQGGELRMLTEHLDLEGLLAESSGDLPWQAGLPTDTRIGHVHLQVADLDQAEVFYCHLLGFQVTQRSFPGALFVSAGGYHHHLGLNTWSGQGAPPPPRDVAGLRYFTVQLPDPSSVSAIVERLRAINITMEQYGHGWVVPDPSGNRVLLRSSQV